MGMTRLECQSLYSSLACDQNKLISSVLLCVVSDTDVSMRVESKNLSTHKAGQDDTFHGGSYG